MRKKIPHFLKLILWSPLDGQKWPKNCTKMNITGNNNFYFNSYLFYFVSFQRFEAKPCSNTQTRIGVENFVWLLSKVIVIGHSRDFA